ncbi:MAG: sugar transferase [Myxococcota bacterium]
MFAFFPFVWEPNDRLWVIAPLYATALVGSFMAGGYRATQPIRRAAAPRAAFGLFIGLGTGWLVLKLLAAKFGLRDLTPPGLWGFAAGALTAATVVGVARVFLLARLRARERSAVVLVLGPAEAARALEARLRKSGDRGPVETVALDGLRAELARPGLRALVLAIAPTGWPRETVEAVAVARAHGLIVTTPARFLEGLFERTPLDALDDPWLVLDEALTHRSPLYLGAKRALDLVGAALALVVAAPLMALIALAVRLSGPGRILYRQERAGLHREPFTLLKFRTMRPDAEDATGPVWAAENDPRATPIGRLLRRSRLDELPQLLNVLRGHMSLVGPRPERPELEHELLPRLPLYVLRHLAKPGLTGWAQVRLPYGASVEDSFAKLEHDLYYLKRASLGFDLSILLRTIPIVLGLRGR